MNAYELQALRHIFAMTIDECATWIAQTGDNESWRQWENGKCAIPDCVVAQLLAMRQQRKKTSSCHHRENKYPHRQQPHAFFPRLNRVSTCLP